MWGEHEGRLGGSRASRGRMTHHIRRRTIARVGRHAISDTVSSSSSSFVVFFFSFGLRGSTVDIVSPIHIAHGSCARREREGVRRERKKKGKKEKREREGKRREWGKTIIV